LLNIRVIWSALCKFFNYSTLDSRRLAAPDQSPTDALSTVLCSWQPVRAADALATVSHPRSRPEVHGRFDAVFRSIASLLGSTGSLSSGSTVIATSALPPFPSCSTFLRVRVRHSIKANQPSAANVLFVSMLAAALH
jgi:hypothetical protein